MLSNYRTSTLYSSICVFLPLASLFLHFTAMRQERIKTKKKRSLSRRRKEIGNKIRGRIISGKSVQICIILFRKSSKWPIDLDLIIMRVSSVNCLPSCYPLATALQNPISNPKSTNRIPSRILDARAASRCRDVKSRSSTCQLGSFFPQLPCP